MTSTLPSQFRSTINSDSGSTRSLVNRYRQLKSQIVAQHSLNLPLELPQSSSSSSSTALPPIRSLPSWSQAQVHISQLQNDIQSEVEEQRENEAMVEASQSQLEDQPDAANRDTERKETDKNLNQEEQDKLSRRKKLGPNFVSNERAWVLRVARPRQRVSEWEERFTAQLYEMRWISLTPKRITNQVFVDDASKSRKEYWISCTSDTSSELSVTPRSLKKNLFETTIPKDSLTQE